MPPRSAGLSKSKLVSFRQCPKKLYLQVHGAKFGLDPAAGELDPLLARNGEDVGQLARALYGPGELIGANGAPLAACLAQTQQVLAGKARAFFEATLDHDGVLVKADVLRRTRAGLEAIEVKSSTFSTYGKNEVKREFLHFDCAVQQHTLTEAGLKPTKFKLAVVDSEFVYRGKENYEGLLKEIDVSKAAAEMATEVKTAIKAARKVLAGDLPEIGMGAQCNKPHDCAFQDFCGKGGPKYPAHRLLTLRNRKNKSVIEALDEKGIEDMRKVPVTLLSDPRDLRIWRAVKTGKAQLDDAAREWAGAFPYPRYYIDFETIGLAVPTWIGTRPYEHVPFQWSCHVERRPGKLEHSGFLSDGVDPPMRAFADGLLKAVGTSSAPIFVYQASFEATRLRALAQRFRALTKPIEKVIARIQDILPVMRDHYYHRDMDGSWSIKDVLPTIAPDLSYDTLDEVQDGGSAQVAYLKLLDPKLPAAERARTRENLLRYCERDTLAMVKIMQFLSAQPAALTP
ncbi:MAG: DUF2779 domain-containing protein [Panacagrimonas sp.]